MKKKVLYILIGFVAVIGWYALPQVPVGDFSDENNVEFLMVVRFNDGKIEIEPVGTKLPWKAAVPGTLATQGWRVAHKVAELLECGNDLVNVVTETEQATKARSVVCIDGTIWGQL